MTIGEFVYKLEGEVETDTLVHATERIVFRDNEGRELEYAGVSGNGSVIVVRLTDGSMT